MKKNRNWFLFLFAFAATGFASSASAQLYLGGGAGQSHLTGVSGAGTTAGVPFSVSTQQRRNAWQAFGGYQFTPNWGIELQYSFLGSRKGNATAGGVSGTMPVAEANQWGLAATGTLPLNKEFYLMGKLGASRNHIDGSTITLAGVTVGTVRSTKTRLLLGGGVGYDFTKNWGVRLEYENFGKFSSTGSPNGGAIKGSEWMLGLKYGF